MAERTVSIVGGGLAGLAAGVSLARRGMRVRIHEISDRVGGCSATTGVDGYTFHDGALFLAMPGLLDAAFARLGLDRESAIPLRRLDAAYEALLPDGSRVTIRGRQARLERSGGRGEATADEEVERLIARWRPVVRLFMDDLMQHPFSAGRLVTRGWRHLPKLRGTVGAELRRAFRDEALQAAMGGVVLYAGVAPDVLPIASIMAIVAFLDEGFFLPDGGMGRIPEALGRELVTLGGEIRLGSAVERIVVEGGRARGLDIAGQGRVASDIVLSTASGMVTLGQLVDPAAVGEGLRRRVQAARLSHRAVGIQLGLSNRIDATSHINAAVPLLPDQKRVFSGTEPGRWLNYMVPTVTDPGLAPAGGSVVEMFCPLGPDAAAPDAREVERMADAATAALSRRHRLDVAVRRVRGPEQFRTGMHLYRGALYGLSPAVSPLDLFPQRTPVRGLYLAGQTTYPGYGVAAATMSGVLAAEQIAAEA
jgi:phytoene desaturase